MAIRDFLPPFALRSGQSICVDVCHFFHKIRKLLQQDNITAKRKVNLKDTLYLFLRGLCFSHYTLRRGDEHTYPSPCVDSRKVSLPTKPRCSLPSVSPCLTSQIVVHPDQSGQHGIVG